MTTERATYKLEIDWDGDGVYEVGEDCSADLIAATIDRGFSDPLARMARVGVATIMLRNSSQAYSPPLVASVRPQRYLRLTMTYGGTDGVIFKGRISSIAPTFGERRERRVTFQCSDDQEQLDSFEGPIALLENTTADAVIAAAVEAVFTPDSTNYQAGVNLFPFSSDRWQIVTRGGAGNGERAPSANAGAKIVSACTADWGRFFISKAGVPTYYNRHQIPLDSTTKLTLDDEMTAMAYEMNASRVYNYASVTCHPRAIGETFEVLARISQGTAPRIDAGGSETFTLRFRDPSNPALAVGGKTVIAPVEATDYAATEDELGEGADTTADLGASATVYGDQAEITLTNSGSAPVYVQKLQVRGIAVRVREPITVVAKDATSYAAYGRRELSVDAVLMGTEAQAQNLADHLIDRYKGALHNIGGVTFFANRNATFMAAARDLDLCDRIVLTESQIGLSAAPLYVYAIRHTIEPGRIHQVTLDLEEGYDVGGTPFTLGSSELDGTDILIY